MHFGTSSDKRLGSRIGAGETKHLMARSDEFLNNGRTDKSGGTSNEYAHIFPFG
jgi:hypothetical protein